MLKVMPQEIEVWYLIPALRKELATSFVKKHNLTQKEASKLLGITEAAVSQYINAKRAADVNFSEEDHKRIDKTAEKILSDKENSSTHLYELTLSFRGSKTLCEIHKKHDGKVPKNCDVCFES